MFKWREKDVLGEKKDKEVGKIMFAHADALVSKMERFVGEKQQVPPNTEEYEKSREAAEKMQAMIERENGFLERLRRRFGGEYDQ